MSFRYGPGINKPGFNALAAQTTTYTYELWSWGQNSSGQLGLGNTTSYSSPKQVGALTSWLTVSSGYQTIATKTDGTLWVWGRNDFGQLGLGNTTYYSSPKQVGALTTWLNISAGRRSSTYAVKTDGTLWAWGLNTSGQLGLGNTTNYSSPKQVGALTTWSTTASGYDVVGAIKTDGTLWMWGNNVAGQLGNGASGASVNSPNQVGALTTWVSVSINWQSTIALQSNGTMWSWGQNVSYGALGLGNTTDYSSPKQIGALTTWSKAVASQYFGVAVKTDGTLWAWGANTYGQLGLGNVTYYSSPKQVGALTAWLKIATAYGFVFSIKTDGTLWSWGFNQNGRLGLGDITSRSSPIQVGALTTWFVASAGPAQTIALKY